MPDIIAFPLRLGLECEPQLAAMREKMLCAGEVRLNSETPTRISIINECLRAATLHGASMEVLDAIARLKRRA